MWTDFLDEQGLSETLSGKVGVCAGENDIVERGVESYTLPEVRFTRDLEERYKVVAAFETVNFRKWLILFNSM